MSGHVIGAKGQKAITLTSSTDVAANQGTTAQTLHGNAAGQCSFAAVDLATEVSGTLPLANGGTNATTAAAARTSIGTGTIWTNSPQATIATGVTSFTTPSGNTNFNTTENVREAIVTRAGTLRNLIVRTSTAQSAGGTFVFTVRINETTSTAITCQFAAGAAAGNASDTTNTAAVAQFDRVSIRAVNNGSGTSASVILVGLEVE